MVRAELELVIELQTDEFWQDVTTSMLEDVRKRLRSLVKFIEKTTRHHIYTDFVDMIGEEREIDLPGFAAVLTLSASATRRSNSSGRMKTTP
jgi:type I restriction enzyme, R subunit